MRYYLYISDSKIEMLLSQIPHAEKIKISSELKVNVGIFTGRFNAETMTTDSKTKRLEFLEKFILKNKEIGPCYNPKSWIKEDDLSIQIIKPSGVMNENSTLFIKRINEHTLFVLGGSTKNMVGNVNTETVYSSYSYTERVLESLECLIRNNDALKYNDEHKDLVEMELNGAAKSGNWELEPLFNVSSNLLENSTIPQQKVSFLAKKLIISKYENKTIIIGSPLYVCKND